MHHSHTYIHTAQATTYLRTHNSSFIYSWLWGQANAVALALTEKRLELLRSSLQALGHQFEALFCSNQKDAHTAVLERIVTPEALSASFGQALQGEARPASLETLQAVVADTSRRRGVRSLAQESVELLELAIWKVRLESAMKGAEPLLTCLDALCSHYNKGIPRELTCLQMKVIGTHFKGERVPCG